MTDTLRGHVITVPGRTRLVSETCISCGTVFGIAEHLFDRLVKNGARFYCPNGHHMVFTQRKTDATKLREAQARETALNDQLRAAIREGDAARAELLRIRQRIANGVCPCCTRSFPNVLAHMATQHPEYALLENVQHAAQAGPFRCSCGNKYDTFRGLRIHQGQSRGDDWDTPTASRWSSHLSVV